MGNYPIFPASTLIQDAIIYHLYERENFLTHFLCFH